MNFLRTRLATSTRFGVAIFLVVTSFAPAALAQDEPESKSSAAVERQAIRGRVIDDGGKPVDGASVVALQQGVPGGRSGRTSTRTSPEGEFVFEDLDPGLYTVWVMSPPLIVVDGIPENGVRPGQSLTIRTARGASITGSVLDKDRRPMTGLVVEPIRVRDEEGVRLEEGLRTYRGGKVDDRGVYRLWGMRPGTYILAAGHPRFLFDQPRFMSDRARTFYPSSNRAGATEVTVRAGDEIANADIAFRGDAGYLITGTVVAAPGHAVAQQTSVELYRPAMPSPDRTVIVPPGGGAPLFRFEAMEDGEYELVARSLDGEVYDSSERKSVRVRGADATGIRLELLPTSSLTGRIEARPQSLTETCESSPDGKPGPPIELNSMAVRIRRVDGPEANVQTSQPKSTGEFAVKQLGSALYRLWLDFADDSMYLESLDRATRAAVPAKGAKPAASGSAPAAGVSSIARDGIRVARGVQVDGVRFVVSRGAARVSGRVAAVKDGDPLPSRLRVCLVPADTKRKDEVIRYAEVEVERDGTFDVRNLAPGDYFVVTRNFPDNERPDAEIQPAAWDPKERTAVRAAAEKAGVRISLAPCQRLESAVVSVTSAP